MVGVLHEHTEAHDWSDWALGVVSAPRSRPTLDTRIGQPTRNASPHMSDPRRLKMRLGSRRAELMIVRFAAESNVRASV
jgi:hypothetical protein